MITEEQKKICIDNPELFPIFIDQNKRNDFADHVRKKSGLYVLVFFDRVVVVERISVAKMSHELVSKDMRHIDIPLYASDEEIDTALCNLKEKPFNYYYPVW